MSACSAVRGSVVPGSDHLVQLSTGSFVPWFSLGGSLVHGSVVRGSAVRGSLVRGSAVREPLLKWYKKPHFLKPGRLQMSYLFTKGGLQGIFLDYDVGYENLVNIGTIRDYNHPLLALQGK